MPILDVDARPVLFVKRVAWLRAMPASRTTLFFRDNTMMLFATPRR
jgi:NAD/NADP transhydrogenase beta subunit